LTKTTRYMAFAVDCIDINNRAVGRGERIRNSGPCLPKTVLYQPVLFPDRNLSEARGSTMEARRNTDRALFLQACPEEAGKVALFTQSYPLRAIADEAMHCH